MPSLRWRRTAATGVLLALATLCGTASAPYPMLNRYNGIAENYPR